MAGLAVAIILGIAALAIVPRIIGKSQADKNLDRAEQQKRAEKGAFGNTYDFFLGEGKYAALFAGDPKTGSQKPQTDARPRGGRSPGRGRGRIG